ncbi:MAG: hypothetical protein ACI35R_13065 [Bacillus sp. (in: firmicutes)]
MAANWRRTSWSVDFSAFEVLEDKLKQIPDKSERIVNRVLHNEGMKITMDEIQPYIPVSHWEGRVRQKRHARSSPALKGETINLGFTVRPKPKFNYLKYPDLGIGQSHRNEPLRFMERGLRRATPKIIDRLMDELMREINRTLGG